MKRKALLALSVVLLLVMTVVPAQVGLADKPEPPDMAGLDAAPATDWQNLPAAVQAGAALKKSLTLDQRAAWRVILDSYLPEMRAIMALAPAEKPSAEAEPQPVDASLKMRTAALLDSINAEMAAVLDAEQLALFRAVMNPNFPDVDPLPSEDVAEALPIADVADPSAVDAVEGCYTGHCFDSAYYGAHGDYLGWLAYTYAAYNYYYHGTQLGYHGYVWAYGARLYGLSGLKYAGRGYFTTYYGGSMVTEDGMLDGYQCFWDFYWAYYESWKASGYFYDDYYTNGEEDLAYLAWYYVWHAFWNWYYAYQSCFYCQYYC